MNTGNGKTTRRDFLRTGAALTGMAAASRWAQADQDGAIRPDPMNPLAPRAPMFPAKAKSVIFIFIHGGLSQMDSFDPKPELDRHHGKKLTGEILPGVKVMTYGGGNGSPLMRSPYRFRNHGQCGMEVSEIFPFIAGHVDDLCFIRSIYGDFNNHAPANYQMNTGYGPQGYPSLGAWVTYALGSRNPDLPGYIVMTDCNAFPIGGPSNWGSGFLPAAFQGTMVRTGGTPILDLKPPADLPPEDQRASLALLRKLNDRHLQERKGDTNLQARMASYELAFRMQEKTPGVVDLSRESGKTREMYGLNEKYTRDLGSKCLMARRLIENGVRFVQVYSGSYQCGTDWDSHGNLKSNHRDRAYRTDRPVAALLADLKRTGLLSETLVVFASEFGRMPISQGSGGRDHNPGVQTMWLAGAGVKKGTVIGASDPIGFKAAEKPFHVRDLHATILQLLGLDDLKLTYYFNGRNQRLTNNGGTLIGEALA